jgi:OmcA/MtrC family decaheme c-type cytochrome
MTLLNARQLVRPRARWVPLLACAALAVAACSGDNPKDGSEGPAGPSGPPGPPPSGGGVPVSSAQSITASIVTADVPEDGRPIIEVRLTNEAGQPLVGLPAANISFALARLEPGVNGKSSTWHAITRRTDAFPGKPAPTPADKVTGTGPRNQGYIEAGTAGTWTEGSQNNGVYTYRFAQSLLGIADIPYDASLVHRVGLEIRTSTSPSLTPTNIPANNGVFTFIPASGGPVASGREIVDNDTCNGCHENLAAHGGARVDLQYCVMCHESYSFDAQSGNSLDMKVMIHKIHRGEDLPSVVAGGFYGIFGRDNTFEDFSDVLYPQDTRYCQTCHDDNDTDTPQAESWRTVVNRESCGSCHDTTNVDTGANHGGVAATDDSCAACHGPNATVENGNLRGEFAHKIPAVEAARRFQYQILEIADTAPGQRPRVTIRVVDPTNGNAPYDIRAAGGPFQNASGSLAVDVAWSTQPKFTNTGSGSATADTGSPAQPIRIDFKANGVANPAYARSLVATAAVAIPAGVTGSGEAFVEGHPAQDVDGDGDLETIPVPGVGLAFTITDADAVAPPQIVDLAKCNACHEQLAQHGNNRVDNIELCTACHNPNATDIRQRVAGTNCEAVTGTLDDQAIDFKYMIHAIHAGAIGGYTVCGFGNDGFDFSDVGYPGNVANCESCHLEDTYYPPDPLTAIATTIDAAPASAPDRSTPAGDIAITPATAACSTCHKSQAATLHMEQNGGSFSAVKNADSSVSGTAVETCGTCHGKDRPTDVAVVHGFAESN